jgi:hypothetical protein
MEDIQKDAHKRYDQIGRFSEGRARVQLNGKYGFIDLEGNEVVPLKYDSVGYYQEGRVIVRLNGKYGVIDLDCKEVVPLRYDWADTFSKGRVMVILDEKYGVIDLDGNEVIPCWYTNVNIQSYGFKATHRVSPNRVMKLHFDKDGHPISEPVTG